MQLQEARRRHPKQSFAHGDVCALRYASDSFDMVSTVYTLRNFPDLYTGLQQMVRVTAPGGSLVIVDAFPPPGLMRFIVKIWLEYIMPPIASFFMCAHPTPPLPLLLCSLRCRLVSLHARGSSVSPWESGREGRCGE